MFFNIYAANLIKVVVKKSSILKKLNSHRVGVENGSTHLFSDFADGGEMWAEQGKRTRNISVKFSENFLKPPSIQIGFGMWDIANGANTRVDIEAENITESGFTIKFQTWGDTQIARMRANWIAIGEVESDEIWDV